jgi:eukaryotic-like serine/threonine-protein kinase
MLTSGPTLPMGTILVVDDEEGMRRFLSKVLEKLGYQVETASDGEAAIQQLKRRRFDLVITDLKMPDLDGVDLLQTIRESGVGTDVLMMSGAGTIPEAVEAMRLGAKNFLEKPIDLQALKKEVRSIFRSRVENNTTVVPSRPQTDAIGRYQLKQQLGAGGMGEVFEGFDPVLKRPVAIKTMLPVADAKKRGELLERFQRESWVTGSLHHPNIVSVYDLGEDLNRHCLYLVMELVEGASLRRLMIDDQIDLGKAVGIASQVADALAYAHRRNIIHRDVKPENVLVEPGGVAKLVDFGIAKLPASDLTGEGRWLGSPNYFSPEMVRGLKLDYRADQFSLGTMLIEMITGARIFDDEDPYRIGRNITDKSTPPLRRLEPDAPEALEQIVFRLHRKDPNERYVDEMELVTALHTLAEQYHTLPTW